MTQKKHILVVGGGFGGTRTALLLSADDRFDVTLVSERPDFWYFPSLYRTVTGVTNRVSRIPLGRILAGKKVRLIIDKAIKLDRPAKILKTESNHDLPYDAIVLALGVETNYFGIPGLADYSYGIKTIQEVEELKTHLHRQLIDDKQPDASYVIVGGGATGIELAGQLPSYLKQIMKNHGLDARQHRIHIDLVEGAPHLMPRMKKSVGRSIERQLRKLGIRLRLGKKVEGATADALMVSGKPIRSHTVIWTAGQANSPFFSENSFELTKRHKVNTDEFLRTGVKEDEVYVIGDNADTPYSGLAQTAQYDAEFVTHNFVKEIEDEPKLAYRPKKPVYVIPAGPHWAAVEWGKVHIYGWLGWFLRESADVMAFNDLENPIEASEQWLQEFVPDHNCPICGDIV
ncbi:MAG: FAD-dependent oxidoreductase [Candidatus Saccharimonadales bacterium]